MDTEQPSGQAALEERAAFMLTECHEFITNLLSYLPAKDLCRSARVCKSWHRIAERLIKSRTNITWSCVNLQEDYDEESHAMALFESDFEECLQSMWSVPSQALVFTEFLKGQESAKHSRRKGKAFHQGHKNNMEAILRNRLPECASVLCLQTPGTVGLKRNFKLLDESESDGGISCLLLPEMDNVQVHQFSSNIEDLNEEPCMELIEQICGPTVVPSTVRCILLFLNPSADFGQSVIRNIQKAFTSVIKTCPVIAGAVVREIKKERGTTEIAGLVFSGPNVSAASILMNEGVSTRQQCKDELHRLKTLDISRGRTVGFMFACIGRGSYHYDETNVESQVFQECFPKVPLFGLFGNGEIGCQNLTMTKDDKNVTDRGLPNLLHGYTTIMVLVNLR